MTKDIATIGFIIPGKDKSNLYFDNKTSLMDADILLISPDEIKPFGDWVSFTTSDGGCYNVSASNRYLETVAHLKKELKDHLSAGKTVFIFLTQENISTLCNGVSSPRKGQTTYSTFNYSNYELMPINIGKKTSGSGKVIQFSGNSIFSDFYSKFKDNLKYELYVENINNATIVFTGKDSSKVLGAVYKVGPGHLVTLPTLTYDESKFTESRDDDSYWNSDALTFGNNLSKTLIEIDQKLRSESDKTPTPDWLLSEKYIGNKEKIIIETINNNNNEIEKILLKNKELEVELEVEQRLKNLLFEQGKLLENAVILALKILGYSAENYDDGKLEMDQVIISPEGHRYIGENEGKDNKDINITKFRQLVDALNEDFARDEVREKAFGILFGNAERLRNPDERTLDFTEKCKAGAEREKIALVRTKDLYKVAQYLSENKNEKYAKLCREAIHNSLGKIVEFPESKSD